MIKEKHISAYIKLTLAIIGWSGVYHSANYLVKHVDLYTAAFTRYLCASIALVIIMKVKNGYIIQKEQFKQNWWLLINLGVVGIGFYNLSFFIAEQYLPASMVALIFSITPCLTALLASLYFKQKLSIFAYAGMIIALLGTVGVINYSNPECNKYWCSLIDHLSTGEISTLFLCFFAALFNIMNRVASQKHIDSLTITTYAAVFGTIVLFIAMLINGHPSELLHQDITFWLVMTYTFAIGSVVSYFWYSEAIKNLGVSKAVVFLNGIPFTTILIGVILFNQPVNFSIIICGIIIIIGVMITNKMINRS